MSVKFLCVTTLVCIDTNCSLNANRQVENFPEIEREFVSPGHDLEQSCQPTEHRPPQEQGRKKSKSSSSTRSYIRCLTLQFLHFWFFFLWRLLWGNSYIESLKSHRGSQNIREKASPVLHSWIFSHLLWKNAVHFYSDVIRF